MDKSKKTEQPRKIDFIERNKLLASKKKENQKKKDPAEILSSKNSEPQNINRPKTANIGRDTGSKPVRTTSKCKENFRPVSAPVGKLDQSRKNVTEKDLISKMILRNLHEPLLRIFLSLSSTTLTASRFVCTAWYSYIKLVFWKEVKVRRELENRLEQQWYNKKLHRMEMKIGSGGLACKKKCQENFRECHCKDKLDCDISGNSLVVDFGGNNFYGEYRLNNNEVKIVREKFDLEQFQLSFHLKLDLKLEKNTWLSTPVFIKKKSLKSKIEFNSLHVERHPGDGTYLLIKDKHTQEIKHRFQTKTRKPVDGLMYSSSRLAVLTGGRVYVYDTKILARGNHGGALLLEPNRNTDDEVHFMFLNENVLVIVGGCKVTMYDFWRFNWSSAIRDFQT